MGIDWLELVLCSIHLSLCLNTPVLKHIYFKEKSQINFLVAYFVTITKLIHPNVCCCFQTVHSSCAHQINMDGWQNFLSVSHWKGSSHSDRLCSLAALFTGAVSRHPAHFEKLGTNVTPQPLATYSISVPESYWVSQEETCIVSAPPYSYLSAKSSLSSWLVFSRWQFLFLVVDLSLVDFKECRVLSQW